MPVTLNCDMGEAFGLYKLGDDAGLMPLITSANIACGGHAGDEDTMRETCLLAWQHGVAIGAHPGFEDRQHFGRREQPLYFLDGQHVRKGAPPLGDLEPFTRIANHDAVGGEEPKVRANRGDAASNR